VRLRAREKELSLFFAFHRRERRPRKKKTAAQKNLDLDCPSLSRKKKTQLSDRRERRLRVGQRWWRTIRGSANEHRRRRERRERRRQRLGRLLRLRGSSSGHQRRRQRREFEVSRRSSSLCVLISACRPRGASERERREERSAFARLFLLMLETIKKKITKKQRALSSARAALDARERELASREASLARAEEEVRRQRATGASSSGAGAAAGTAAAGTEKNWPPCCSVLHHDIAGEVPFDAQAAVTSAYRAYLGLVLCLVYNCAAAFARLAANKVREREEIFFSFREEREKRRPKIGKKTQKKLKKILKKLQMEPTKLPAFLMSAIYLTAGVPGAWVLWYARLYHAAIKDRAITYLWFFLMFSAHLIFCCWSAIAPPIAGGAAHAGFVEGVAALSKSAFVGGVYLAGGCLWSLESVWSLWTLQRAYATFRGHGADRRLKAELQAAGADAAAVAAGAAIRGGAGGGRV